ncbi:MAG: VCBS repeat-containing protein [Alphaproteobacteria bacterium]|nr:VCBS repeat-containing protein [Alphaproteobacteria bacterium]
MPLLPIPIDLPPHFVEATAGDVDADGRRELVLVSSPPKGPGEPRAVTLEEVHFSADGRLERRDSTQLPARAAWWSAEGALWRIDDDGLFVRSPEGWSRLAALNTPLSGLGPTTPVQAGFSEDLDGDGQHEAWVYSRGRFHVYSEDGRSLGSFAAPAQGSLADRDEQGGRSLRATLRVPTVLAGDFDGDGVKDLLLPDGSSVLVVPVRGPQGVVELGTPTRVTLPRALVDPDEDEGETQRSVTDVEFRDVDGDGLLDLVVHEVVTEGSFFGATAEVHLYRGDGRGFRHAQTLATGTGSADLSLHDLDGDGDLDLVLGQVDVSFSNLARGLVAREVEVQLSAYLCEDGVFSQSPTRLEALSVDLSDPSFAWTLWGDFDGDDAADLAWMDGDVLKLRLSGDPDKVESLRLTVKVEQLMAHDVTGDGVPELLAWAPGEERAVLVRLTD